MEALYNQSGQTYAWLHESSEIYSLDGKNLAFVDGNSVYDWSGKHIGWWRAGHIRDSSGAVALFTADAQINGVVKPVRQLRPLQPMRQLRPIKPMKSLKPLKPFKQLAWSDHLPF